MAGRAFFARHHKGDFLLDPLAAGLTEAALKVGHNALKAVQVGAGAEHGFALHLDLFVAGAVQDCVQRLLAQLLDRGVERETEPLAKRLIIHLADRAFGIIPAAGLDCAFADRLAPIRQDAGRVHLHESAKAGAGFTGAKRVVKAEHPGVQLFNRDAVLRAGIVLAEGHRFTADHINGDQPAGQRKRGLDRISQPAADGIAHRKPVHDNFNGVLDVFFQLDLFVQVIHVAVNPHPGVAAAAGRVQLLGLGAFASAHNRRQDLEPGARRQLHNLVNHLVNALLGDLPPANGAMRNADPRIHQAQIVINLGHGADG